ncbi:MAG: (Fe-S)-binding protein [Chlorobi bacterium]|nr:(Fe-S)-binding protein [Chlorobiota bacterium]
MVSRIIFILLVLAGFLLFSYNVRRIIKNINKGKPQKINDNIIERFKIMFRVAIGQSKMVRNPIAGILHIIVYAGFIIINIEFIEIILDGILGTHRIFAPLGIFYNALIGIFEILAILVIVACLIFLVRRNILRVKRFHFKEMTLWPRSDANIILIVEVFLMSAFLIMNASDSILQTRGVSHFVHAGAFPVSSFLMPALNGLSDSSLEFVERFCWWFHIIGIFAFLNYLPYSKHFHIILAFPNVFYSKLEPRAKFTNMESVTNEVKLMLDPNADPYASNSAEEEVKTFGAKDIADLSWKSLMDAYSCTECGRCSAVCPANITGKKLSPRKIMMDTRDRMERAKKNNEKELLKGYILPEEVWACTTCNACTQECPVNIDHVSLILELRRYIVLEESAAPSLLNSMFTNIENNGAPWQYPPSERIKWADELYINQ